MTLSLSVPTSSPHRHPTNPQQRRREEIHADAAITGIGVLFLLCFCTLSSPVAGPWAMNAFEAGVLCLTAFWIQRLVWTGRPITVGRSFYLTAAIPALGVLQILTGVTVYQHVTREAILFWATICCLVLLSNSLCTHRVVRHCFLLTLVCLTIVLVLVNMRGLAGAGGLLPVFESSGWKSFGLQISSNQFAELIELALPVCLARALLDRNRWFFYALASAVLFAAAIGCRSRAGAALATAEVIAVLASARWWGLVPVKHWRTVAYSMAVAALALAGAIGVGGLFDRLRDPAPLAGRAEIFTASLKAIEQRPLTGFGLGSFSTVYPAFAVRDLSGFVNHAHDEWLEALADGGLPLLAILLVLFARLVKPASKSLWGLGVVAMLLHGAVDFPLQRMVICAWTFVIAGALEAGYFSTSTGLRVSPDSGLARSRQ